MNEAALSLSHREDVRKLLSGVAQLPLYFFAQVTGKSVNSFLAAATGISLARISEGNLADIQQSTVDRGRKKVISAFRTKALRNGCSPEDFENLVTAPSTTSAGTVALWVTFIESLDLWKRLNLSHTRNTAHAFDELLVVLMQATKSDDFQRFKDTLRAFCTANQPNSISSALNKSGSHLWATSQTSGWCDALAHLNLAFDELLLEVFAAFDAECSAQFFSAMQPRPLLLSLAARINPVWDIDNAAHLKRNRVFRPSRRLLELLHSIMHCHLHGRWPDAVPGRKDIADACGWSETVIGNFIDGTKKLTLANCEVMWNQSFTICKGNEAEPPLFPKYLAAIALSLEGLLVRQTKQYKLKEWFLLDEDSYRSRWEFHRLQLPNAEITGSGMWPDWLTNQSLSSEFVRSSQSSGRSSSPRECQYSSWFGFN